MATFPSTLPAPNTNGFALSPASPFVRTDMEFGAARQRLRTKARYDSFNVKWQFSDAQMASFRAWFESSTGANWGTSWFDISLPSGDGGMVTKTARFSSMWKASMFGVMYWEVTAQLEVR